MVFGIIPEYRSDSSRNRVHVRPESPDQRGHGLGVSMEQYIQADLEQKLKAVGTFDSDVIQ